MALSVLRFCAFFVVLLFAFPLFATESSCIAVSFSGTDKVLEGAVLRQLKTELKIPIYKEGEANACWRLVIEMQDKTSQVSLTKERVFDTVIHLDDFLPTLWPRAIALSISGLWILAQNQETEVLEDSTSEDDRHTRDEEKPKPAENEEHRAQEQEDLRPNEKARRIKKRAEEEKKRPLSDVSRHRIRFQMTAGARLIPKLKVGVFDAAFGIGIQILAVQVDLGLLGVFGRKSLEYGKIFTTGGGVRTTVFWQGLKSRNIGFGIGPSVEVIAVYGFGRGKNGVDSHQGISPVINLLLLVGGWFELSPRLIAHVALGGGWTAMYFNMQLDGKTVSGISGGSVNGILGFSFGRLK